MGGDVAVPLLADDGVTSADVFEADFSKLGLANQDVDSLVGSDAQVGNGDIVVVAELVVQGFVVSFAESDEGGLVPGVHDFPEASASRLEHEILGRLPTWEGNPGEAFAVPAFGPDGDQSIIVFSSKLVRNREPRKNRISRSLFELLDVRFFN